jgi:hypothetical protein
MRKSDNGEVFVNGDASGTEPPPFTPFKDLDAIVRFDARNVKAWRDSCRKPATNLVMSHSRPPRQTVRRFSARVTFPNTGSDEGLVA